MKKTITFLLAVMITLSVAVSGTVFAAPDTDVGRKKAFEQVVQGLADKYGFVDEEMSDYFYEYDPEQCTGFVDAETMDVNYDGDDELFCVWYDKGTFNMCIYEYKNGNINEAWHQAQEGAVGIFGFGVAKADGIIYWTYRVTRYFSSDIITYVDGQYKSAADIPFTSEENDRAYVEAYGKGLSAEGEANRRILMEHLGIERVYNNADTTILMGISVEGALSRNTSTADEIITRWNINGSAHKGFTDISSGHWAYEYINALSQSGIISGYEDGTFRADNKVTRAQWARMLSVAGKLDTDVALKDCADMDNDHWAASYMAAADPYLSAYTVDGKSYYYPDRDATREEVVVSLAKLKGYTSSDSTAIDKFTDSGNISAASKEYISAAIEQGLVSGYEDGTFRPNNSLTRAEAAILICRAFGIETSEQS